MMTFLHFVLGLVLGLVIGGSGVFILLAYQTAKGGMFVIFRGLEVVGEEKILKRYLDKLYEED